MMRFTGIEYAVLMTALMVGACVPAASTSGPATAVLPPSEATPATASRPKPPILPTLDYDVQDQLYALLADNGNCRLPCFLGITPDVTSLVPAMAFLQGFSNKEAMLPDDTGGSIAGKTYYVLIWTGKDVELMLDIRLTANQDRTVRYIEFSSTASRLGTLVANDRHLTAYSLSELFRVYGMPDVVFMTPLRQGVYSIYAVYEKLKFVVGVGGLARQDASSAYQVCPDIGDGDITSLELAAAGASDPIDVKTLLAHPFSDVPTFAQTAGFDVDGFYSLMTDGQQPACFEIR